MFARPGDSPSGEIFSVPAGIAQRLGDRGRTPTDVAGDDDRDVPWDLVEPLAELTHWNVHTYRIGPGGHLIGLPHVEQKDSLTACDPGFDHGGFDLGVGHGSQAMARDRCFRRSWMRRYLGLVPLPRKFLNEDEELLAELRPHWIFLFGPLFTSIGVWAAIVAILVVWRNAPGWTNYPFLILALIPGLWLLGRAIRWRSYDIALTSTRILVRQGIFKRDTVQLRLQRITEVNISQTLIERMLGVGRIVIDVQGEDDSMTLEYVRKPAVVQRVINSQINEIVGGGRREAVPPDMLPYDQRRGPRDDYDHYVDDGEHHDTPPFGVQVTGAPPSSGSTGNITTADASRGVPFEIRDRLIELDDLRRRGIISEEEFAAKKSELLNRI